MESVDKEPTTLTKEPTTMTKEPDSVVVNYVSTSTLHAFTKDRDSVPETLTPKISDKILNIKENDIKKPTR